jgi:nicotinamide mononucleotide adenylyltransferase
MKRYARASVHGRFQPPHLEHLEYILTGLDRADHLVIGITQPYTEDLADCPEDPHRAETRANPFTYAERVQLISKMLLANGIDSDRFSFSPFPIEKPELLLKTVSCALPCLTTIRDSWNQVKIDRLRQLGYVVDVLWDRSNVSGIQGTDIRDRIRANDPSWRERVHPAVSVYLEESGLLERVRSQK